MAKFRKKPETIDAMQWTGDNFYALATWDCSGVEGHVPGIQLAGGADKPTGLMVSSWKGWVIAEKGDWLVRDHGLYVPHHPDVFERLYEAAE